MKGTSASLRYSDGSVMATRSVQQRGFGIDGPKVDNMFIIKLLIEGSKEGEVDSGDSPGFY